MQEEIIKLIESSTNYLSKETIRSLLEIPSKKEMGDYAIPCFSLAKEFHKSPNLIATELKISIDSTNSKILDKTEVVGGYLNLYVEKNYFMEKTLDKIRRDDVGLKSIGEGKTICMDYSSPNIAKNFHVGHLRTTLIGNSLYKIYSKLGYKVVRINYLGDWGTQFGKLIVAYKYWSSEELVEKDGIQELLRIYVLFHDELDKNPELIQEARAWFVKMEQGDEEALSIWKWFYDISMIEFKAVYELLNIEFDYYLGESFYKNKVSGVVEELEQKGLLTFSQGAKVVNLDEYKMPPCLISKSDGSSIYPSRDLAAIFYRKKNFNFYKCLYVTGSEQKLHFTQVFKVVELMGYDWSSNLVHIPYGLVSLDGEKLSSRGGNIIYADDILKEAIQRCLDMTKTKNPDLKDKEKVAKMVGIGAVVFHDLYNQRIKDINFSWDEVLNFDGATGPYVQYTYARAKSILRKNTDFNHDVPIDYSLINDEYSYELIKKLDLYNKCVIDSANLYEPSILAKYVVGFAQDFNAFYHQCPINTATKELKDARLLLVYATQKIINEVMNLLGIQCPEEM